MTTQYTLVIDARERYVIRHAAEFTVPYITKQITIGDYAILNAKGDIVAIIERKSHEDAAASLKDGRWGNREKLKALRQQTGCTIFFIIEGRQNIAPNKAVGGIQWKYIESSIIHMMVRDGFSFLYTADTIDTARMLCRLVDSLKSLDHESTATIADLMMPVVTSTTNVSSHNDITSIDNSLSADEFLKLLSATNVSTVSTDVINDDTDVIVDDIDLSKKTGAVGPTSDTNVAASIGLLSQPITRSDHDIVRGMWSCFGGIAHTTADEFIKKYSLLELYTGAINDLDKMKMSTGRAISKTVLKSLANCHDIKTSAKILAEVPGVSRKTADELLQKNTLRDLLTAPDIASKMVNGKRFGVRADAVKRLFTFTTK